MSLHAVSGKHQDGTAWAKTPPPGGARGSRWEAAILELAEAGEPRWSPAMRLPDIPRGPT